MDFYVTVATIVPVLFLAVIYQVRLFTAPEGRELSEYALVLGLVLLALMTVLAGAAEIMCLHVLGRDHASTVERDRVGDLTITLVFFTFLGPAAVGVSELIETKHPSAAEKARNARDRALMRWIAAIALVVLVGLLVVFDVIEPWSV